MGFSLNTASPHARDIDRFIAACEKFETEDISVIVDKSRASTGSVYLTVTVSVSDESGKDLVSEVRKYRFGSHADCYATTDYSVHSGGVKALEQYGYEVCGFDGRTTDAIADVRRWIKAVVAKAAQ